MTAAKKNQPAKAAKADDVQIVTENRRARHDYEILDKLECGIMLLGTEVKSLRGGKASLAEAYGRVKQGELWLMGCEIAEYPQANRFNHEPRRPRKLLLHRQELSKFAARADEKGLTLVPLKLYFKRGKAKVLLAIAKGRKTYDKREKLKKADAQREISRELRRR